VNVLDKYFYSIFPT